MHANTASTVRRSLIRAATWVPLRRFEMAAIWHLRLLFAEPRSNDYIAPNLGPKAARSEWQLYVDFVEEPCLRASTIWVSGVDQRGAKQGLSASRDEDRLREGDELRQFPQILGGGG